MSHNQNKQHQQQQRHHGLQQQQQHHQQQRQQQQQQQQQWHHAHVEAAAGLNMFTNNLYGGGGTGNACSMGGGGGGGGGGGFDLEIVGCASAAVAYDAYPTPSQLQQHHEQQLQHQQQMMMNIAPETHMLTPTIEMDELIIKTEPLDEPCKINLVDDDSVSYVDFTKQQQQHHHHQQQQQHEQYPMMSISKIEHIKEELPLTSQQKSLNFPRRKMQTERSETLPICQRCKQVFFKKYSYTRHVAQSACDILEYDFKCVICPMSFMSGEELQMHEQLHRTNKFFCHKYCGKYFDTIELCEVHEFVHHDYANFVCNICTATFPKREFLFAHMPMHENQQRFDCPVCRLWFQLPHELHQHRLAAPYYCGKYYVDGGTQMQASDDVPFSATAGDMPHLGQKSYNLQDCRMGVIEMPSTSNFLPFANNNRHYPLSNNYPGDSGGLPIGLHNNNNNFQIPLPIKTELKTEPDFYPNTSINDYSQNLNDFSNDSCGSSGMNNAMLRTQPPPLHYNNVNYQRHHHQQQQQRQHSGSNNIFNISNLSISSGNTTPQKPPTPTTLGTIDNDVEDAECCVPKCGVRKSTSPTLQFFEFPKHEKYLHQWLHNLKMLLNPPLNLANLRICSLHFPKRCINRYSLCYWAVPTFNLGHDDVANLYQNREHTNAFAGGSELARCSMPGCSSERAACNIKFYNFPKDTKTLIKWCQNARLAIYGREPRHFCGRHFEERCFGKFRLKPWAVPTLHLGTPYGKIHDNPGVLYLEEKKCCLTHCRRTRSSDFNLSLYRFPRDETMLQRWCYNLRLEPETYRGKNHKICSAHFVKEALGLRKLSPGAVPTLNLGHNDTFNIYENELYTPTPPPPASSSKIYNFHNTTLNYPSVSPSNYTTSSASTSAANIYDSIDVCFVPSCKRNRNIDNITLHTLPRRPEHLEKWCHNLKLDAASLHKAVRICSAHFESFCIGGCMRPFAVPTLNLGHDDPNIYRNPDVIKRLNIRETCCVQTCRRNRDRDHANLHRFPSKPIPLEKWCQNLRKPVPDGSRLFNDAICEMHFEDRCIRNKRLEKWAVPTLNLGYPDVVHELPTEAEVAELYAKPVAPNLGDEEGECCVATCKRNPEVDDIKLYRMPENAEVLAKWSHNLQLDVDVLPVLRICNLHFESHCIGKKLHTWAIPTLNLAHNVENLYENPETLLVINKKTKIKKEKVHKYHLDHNMVKQWLPRCCLPHCGKTRSQDNVQLFRLPNLNRNMLAKWCHNIQLPMVGSSHRRICSAHFEPYVLTKKCPMHKSVPTLDLNTPPGYKIYQNPAQLKLAKMRLQRVCIIASCRKTRIDGVQLFRYPHNRSFLRKWGHNTRQPTAQAVRAQYRVCSSHFEPHSFGTRRLCPGAIPTLNLDPEVKDPYPNEAQSFAELQCCVNGCDAIKETENVRLFKFPCDDEDLLWKWCNNLKMNPVDCQGVRICNRHFEADCMGSKLLYKWSIPTLELGHDDAEIELIANPKPDERYTSEVVFKCCVPTCRKTRKYDDAQMNSFPKNIKTFQRWKHNLNLEYLDFKKRENYKICNDHFEDICLGKTRLNYGAIPTLNLGHDNTSDLFQVKPEQIHSTLFGRQKSSTVIEDSPLATDDGNDDDPNPDVFDEDEQNSESILPDSFVEEIEAKCSYPACTASKTVLRETYDLPSIKHEQLFKLWLQHMQVDKDTLLAEKSTPKICGLHFMQIYDATIEATSELVKDYPELDTAVQALNLANERCCNSLVIRSAQCSVRGCGTTQLTDHKLYQFPYNRDLIEKWSFNTGIEVDEHRRYLHKVCSLHFEDYCLTETQRLRTWAIPTLQLNHDEPDNIHQNPDLVSMERRMLGPVASKCCVASCGRERTDDDPSIRLFNFPTDEALLAKWAHNLRLEREQCPLFKLCEQHFERNCYGNTRLRSWALPTLNLGHSESDIHLNIDYNADEDELKVEKVKIKKSLDSVKCYLSRDSKTENDEPKLENVKIKKSLDSIKCCVNSCQKSRLSHGVRLLGFPTDQVILKKWCHNLQLSLVMTKKHPRICNIHFHKRCFDGKSLFLWAVPTMQLGHSDVIYDNPKVVPPKPIPTKMSNFAPTCALEHCGNKRTATNTLRTFGFPKNEEILQKWCDNLKLTPEDCKGRICVAHFEADVMGHRKLKIGAVPTLNLGHEEELKFTNESLIHSMKLSSAQDTILEEDNLFEESVTDVEESEKEHKLITGDENEEEEEDESIMSIENAASSSILFAEQNSKLLSHSSKNKSANKCTAICCLKHCRKEKTPEHHLTTFGFPKDKILLRKWCDNLKLRPEEAIGRVCIEHFDLEMVTRHHHLVPGTVPTLKLGHNETLRHTNSGEDINSEEEEEIEGEQEPTNLNVDEIKTQQTNLNINNDSNLEIINTDTNSSSYYAEKLSHSVFRICCLKHCRRKKDQNSHSFGFPKHNDLLQKWCDNLRISTDDPIISSRRICDAHFEPSAFGKLKLAPGAVPTLNLTADDDKPIHNNSKLTTDYVPRANRSCNVSGCGSITNYEYQTFFGFPKDFNLSKKWCDNLKLELQWYTHYHICKIHFEPHCIAAKRLRPWAIPTLNLGHSDAPQHMNPTKHKKILVGNLYSHHKAIKREGKNAKKGRCCIKSCGKTRLNHKVKMYAFPKRNQVLASKWRYNTKHMGNQRICSEHFEKHAISRVGLRPWAIPTLNLGHHEHFYDNPTHRSKELQNVKCCIKNCDATTLQDLFAFPKRGALLRKWAHNTKQNAYIAQRRDYRVCRRHFQVNCFDTNEILKSNAVPTLHLEVLTDAFVVEDVEDESTAKNLRCSLPTCGRSVGIDRIRLFPFPKDKEQLMKWCNNLQLTVDGCLNFSICNLHFESSCITKLGLRELAIPTIMLGHTIENTKLYLNPVFGDKSVSTVNVFCCVAGCGKSKQEDGIRMNSFPKNRTLYMTWMHNLKLKSSSKVLSTFKVCDDHFEDACKGKRHLKSGAIPTLKLGHSDKNLYRNNVKLLNNSGKRIKRQVYEATPKALKCIVPECNVDTIIDMKLFALPVNEELRSNWCKFLNVDMVPHALTNKSKLCALHFMEAYHGVSNNKDHVETAPDSTEPDEKLNINYEKLRNTAFIKRFNCCVPGCDTNYTHNIRLYKFPKNAELCEKWQQNTKININTKSRHLYRVCGLHFEDTCSGSTRLRPGAVPTLRLNHSDHIYPHLIPKEQQIRCCVESCKSGGAEVKLWNFPRDTETLEQWCHNLELNACDSKTLKICSSHFESYCIGHKQALRVWAVPTLKLNSERIDIFHNPESETFFYTCCISTCRQTRDDDAGIMLYTFPKAEELYQKWVHNVRMDEAVCRFARICTLHFEKRVVGKKLFKLAVPTLDLGHDADIFQNPKMKRKKMQLEQCSLPHCGKIRRLHHVTIFTFPTDDQELLEKWMHNLNMAQLFENGRICNEHFETGCVRLRKLQPWALPTLNLGHTQSIFENPQFKKTESRKLNSLTYDKSQSISSVQNSRIIVHTCCISTCRHNSVTEDITVQLFNFPKIPWLREKWCQNTQTSIGDATNLRICAEHFEPNTVGKTKPRPWAIPTLQLGHDERIYENPKQLHKYHPEEKECGEIKYVRSNYCAIISCLKSKKDGVHLYKYPRKGMLLQKWADNCKHYKNQAARYGFQICSEHFEKNCFNEVRLKFGSVPTLKLGHNDTEIHRSEWRQEQDVEKSNTTIPLQDEAQHCDVPNCKNTKSVENVKLHKFPENSEILAKWCHNLKLAPENCKNLRICNMHFESRCFGAGRVLLRAIPTLLLGHMDVDIFENPDSFEKPEVIVHCCVANCGKSKSEDQVQLSQFPKLRSLIDKWLHNLKLPATSEVMHNYKVCSDHFESYCYEHGRLKFGSIPSLKLGHDDDDIYLMNQEMLLCKSKRKAAACNKSDINATETNDITCCYPSCMELGKTKTKGFEVPNLEILRVEWLKTIDSSKTKDPENSLNDLRLCSIHFKLVYDKNLMHMENLQKSIQATNDADNSSIEACLSKLRSNYTLISSSTRVRSLTCSVPTCTNSQIVSQIKLFQFPYNRELMEKWCHNTRITFDDDRRYMYKVCSDHFERYCYAESSKRIKSGAIPTLNLPHDDAIFTNPDFSINMKCCIPSCENAKVDETVTSTTQLFNFPRDTELLNKWLYNTQLNSREAFNARICALHFEKHCINKRLRSWALPTLLLGHDTPELFQNPKSKTDELTEEMTNEWETQEEIECIGDETLNDITKTDLERPVSSKKTKNIAALKINDTLNVDSNENSTATILPESSNNCRISGCRGRKGQPNITMHKFPADKNVFQMWAHNTQCQADKKMRWKFRICSCHFAPECWLPHKPSHLRHGTTPTLHLGPNRPKKIYESNFELKKRTKWSLKVAEENTTADLSSLRNDQSFLSLGQEDDEDEIATDECIDFDSDTNQIIDFGDESICNETREELKVTLVVDHIESVVEETPSLLQTKKNTRQCRVIGCSSEIGIKGIIMHKFPKIKKDFQKWVHNTQIKADINYLWKYRICGLHFDPECYFPCIKPRFRPGTMPTLNLGPNRPAKIFENDFVSEKTKNTKVTEIQHPEEDIDSMVNVNWETNEDDEIFNDSESEKEPSIASKQTNESAELMVALEVEGNKDTTRHCSIVGCSIKLQKGVTMHNFPVNDELFQKWTHNTQLQIDKNMPWRFRICNRHFEPKSWLATKKARLHPGTVPTLHLGPNRPATIYENIYSTFTGNDSREVADSVKATDNTNDDELFTLNEPSVLSQEEEQEDDYEIDNIVTDSLDIELTSSKSVDKKSIRSSNSALACAIPTCVRRMGQKNIRLHKLPLNSILQRKWIYNCRLDPDDIAENHYAIRICSLHFEKKCYLGTNMTLRFGSLPTLHLGHDDVNIYQVVFTNHGVTAIVADDDDDLEKADDEVQNDDVNLTASETSAKITTCCVSTCGRSGQRDKTARFSRFPQTKKVLAKWLHNLKMEYDAARPWDYNICELHFVPAAFDSDNRLYEYAVPTLHLGRRVKLKELRSMSVPPVEDNKATQDLVECSTSSSVAVYNYNEVKSGYKKCSLIHCQKSHKKHNIKTYHFPKSMEYQEKWEYNLRIKYDATRPWKFLICSKHFEAKCFHDNKPKTRLFKWAVPTLNLGKNTPANIFTLQESCEQYEAQRPAHKQQKNAENPKIAKDAENNYQDNNQSSHQNEEEEEEDVEEELIEPLPKRLRLSVNYDSFSNASKTVDDDESATSLLQLSDGGNSSNVGMSRFERCHCCLPHCRRGRTATSTLFRAPTDADLLAKWAHNLRFNFSGRNPNRSLVCNEHFEPAVLFKKNKQLTSGALPTLNLGYTPTGDIYKNSVEVAGPKNLSSAMPKSQESPPALLAALSRPPTQALHCHVAGCLSHQLPTCDLYPFPVDENFIKIWTEKTCIAYDPKRHNEIRVCGAHFEAACFKHLLKRNLRNTAIPTLNLPGKPPKLIAVTPKAAAQPPPPPLKIKQPQKELSSASSSSAATAIACSVPLCRNTSATNGIKLFSKFPEDFELFTKWCFNLKVDPRKYVDGAYHVCSAHFEPSCIGGHSLRVWAVPTLHLGHSSGGIHKVERPAEAETKCCLPHCGRKKSLDGVSFYCFPKGDTYKAWCQILQIDEGLYRNKDKKICSAHFTADSFMGALLKPHVKPMLLLGPKATAVACSSNSSVGMVQQEKRLGAGIFVNKCIVRTCHATQHLYKFPDNRNLCVKWCHNLKIDYDKKLAKNPNFKLCPRHFEANCMHQGRLHPEAVPTLQLAHTDSNIFQNTAAFGLAPGAAPSTPSYDDNSSLRTSVGTVNTLITDTADMSGADMDIEDETYYAEFEARHLLPQSTFVGAENVGGVGVGVDLGGDGAVMMEVIDLDDEDDDDEDDIAMWHGRGGVDFDEEEDDDDDDDMLLQLD